MTLKNYFEKKRHISLRSGIPMGWQELSVDGFPEWWLEILETSDDSCSFAIQLASKLAESYSFEDDFRVTEGRLASLEHRYRFLNSDHPLQKLFTYRIFDFQFANRLQVDGVLLSQLTTKLNNLFDSLDNSCRYSLTMERIPADPSLASDEKTYLGTYDYCDENKNIGPVQIYCRKLEAITPDILRYFEKYKLQHNTKDPLLADNSPKVWMVYGVTRRFIKGIGLEDAYLPQSKVWLTRLQANDLHKRMLEKYRTLKEETGMNLFDKIVIIHKSHQFEDPNKV